jgi:serine phosphatase RsbU (regulator of sigma subunit)
MADSQKILIVDDEPFNINYLEQELEDLGYNTISAPNGRKALELVEMETPDLILLDIMMPVMDGFEVLSLLKAEETWRDIPVVVISALSDMESVIKGIELGADDYLPKPFDPKILNARLQSGLERKQLRDLEQQYIKSLERELEIGRDIQSNFLPKEIPQFEGWEVATFFKAAREVAGDFYDIFHLPEGKIGLVWGDVCDKGVGSALYMALIRSLLRAVSGYDTFIDTQHDYMVSGTASSVGTLIENTVMFVNQYICKVHNSATFATMFFGALDPITGNLSFINAGHEPPVIIDIEHTIKTLMPTGPAVGILDNASFLVRSTSLIPGNLLLGYSDGVTDSQNSNGEMFDKARLLSIEDRPTTSARALLADIISEVETFMGESVQNDDITLVALKRV